MMSLEKKRQIERWALDVADCATGIDELKLSDETSPRIAEPISTDRLGTSRISNYPTKSYVTTAVKPVTTTRLSPPPRKEPQIFRVVVQPSSSEGSARAVPKRSRSTRSTRRYVLNTSGSSRSRRAYADSIESSVRRRRSPPRSVRSRRSPSPSRSPPKYNVIRRVLKPPAPPEPETRSRYYTDERPRYYEEERLRRPAIPSRPRPRSMDARDMYYARPRSPETKRMFVRSPSPDRPYYTTRSYRDEPPRRTVSIRSKGGDRYVDGPMDDTRADSAKRLSQLYDDANQLRSIGARRLYPEDDSRRRRRSFVYSPYDDYDDYDDRRLVR